MTITATHKDGSQMTVYVAESDYNRKMRLLVECGYVRFEEVR